MSETHQSHPSDPGDQTPSSAANWFTGWDSFTTDDAAPSIEDHALEPSASAMGAHAATAPSDDSWQTVDFPNAISMDAIDRQLLYAQPAAPAPVVSDLPLTGASPTVRMEDISEGNAQPQIDELISLIQELNQCNNALLDRVSQLEDTLDHYQANGVPPGAASSSAVGPSWHHSPHASAPASTTASESENDAGAQAQIAQLANELEFTRQAHKRQEILVETLKGQLENSQERVAQLERECALIQQKYNEQAQMVAQYDNTCRDLRARLHRQQRYTMQFKVALEKSLEVPPPSYAAAPLDPLQPDIHIPLWYEAQTSLSQELLPKIQRIQPWSSQSQSKFLEKLNLAALTDSPELRPLADTISPAILDAPATSGQGGAEPQSPPVSYTIKAEEATSPTVSSPVVELSDLTLTEANLASLPEDVLPEDVLPEDVIKAGVAEFQAVLNSLWDEEGASTDPDANPFEEGLWKDLARLIDVSPDELVKASLANNFDAFTEGATEALPHAPGDTAPAGVADLPSQAEPPQPEPATASDTDAKVTNPFIANPNWPSPLVHPLRPSRKLSSLAAVNLPKFAQ